MARLGALCSYHIATLRAHSSITTTSIEMDGKRREVALQEKVEMVHRHVGEGHGYEREMGVIYHGWRETKKLRDVTRLTAK
jgi:hypothetical protein